MKGDEIWDSDLTKEEAQQLLEKRKDERNNFNYYIVNSNNKDFIPLFKRDIDCKREIVKEIIWEMYWLFEDTYYNDPLTFWDVLAKIDIHLTKEYLKDN